MPAYFHPDPPHGCGYPRCQRKADGQVFNTVNAPVGWYCEPHGLRLVEEMNTGVAVWDSLPSFAQRIRGVDNG